MTYVAAASAERRPPPPWRTSRAGNLKQSEVSWGVRRERKGKR